MGDRGIVRFLALAAAYKASIFNALFMPFDRPLSSCPAVIVLISVASVDSRIDIELAYPMLIFGL